MTGEKKLTREQVDAILRKALRKNKEVLKSLQAAGDSDDVEELFEDALLNSEKILDEKTKI